MLIALLLAASPPLADPAPLEAFAEVAASVDGVGTAGGGFFGLRRDLGFLSVGGRVGAVRGSLAYFTPIGGVLEDGTRVTALTDVGPVFVVGPARLHPILSVGAGLDVTARTSPVLVTGAGATLDLRVRPGLSTMVGARMQNTLGEKGFSGGLLLTGGLSFSL